MSTSPPSIRRAATKPRPRATYFDMGQAMRARGEFSSRLGFILAASGSAVGLGNVWAFPTNTASNGGAAFVLVYLVLAFCLAYPALMAELIIGRHTRANICTALQSIATSPLSRQAGKYTGMYGLIVAGLILSFYSLVAGWMIAQLIAAALRIVTLDTIAHWFETGTLLRDTLCALVFALLTIAVISEGVTEGIERWSTRLMPSLVLLLVALIAYVLSQKGAMDGLAVYLLPDFSRIFHPSLIISALGQAFFSLSLGVGTMLIYGSYIREEDNLPVIGATVTLFDIAVAFLAGMLIIPALFVAREQGIVIYDNSHLVAGPDLIFQVLPGLFTSMGYAGHLVALAFFALMTIAALTSSISMLEGPVAFAVETTKLERPAAAWLIGSGIFAATLVIGVFFDELFGVIVTATTEYSQPLLGIILCLFAGWVMNRNSLLNEIRAGNPNAENTVFWALWPFYVRFICPVLIGAAFLQGLLQ